MHHDDGTYNNKTMLPESTSPAQPNKVISQPAAAIFVPTSILHPDACLETSQQALLEIAQQAYQDMVNFLGPEFQSGRFKLSAKFIITATENQQ